MGIPIPVELDRCTPAVVGGLLSGACPLPADWERGISFQDTACLTPTVMGECPTCPDLKPTQRATTETFRPVSLITAIECSTFGGIDIQQTASQTLAETSSWALARELLTGEASRRDANPNAIDGAGGNPALQTHATLIDSPEGAIGIPWPTGLGCLEQALADATGGRRGYILIGPELALELWPFLIREGNRVTTLTGTRVIVDPGFDGRPPVDASPGESPGCEPWNSGGEPLQGDPMYIYAVAGLWAQVGQEAMISDVNRENNTASARAEAPALAAFTPCAAFAMNSGIPKVCGPLPESPVL
jgi:hypothetical protein